MKKLVLTLWGLAIGFSAFAQLTENFEGTAVKTAYASATVNLTSGSWLFTNALLGTSTSDRLNGVKSVRIKTLATGPGVLEMQFNISSAGTFTVYHAKYGTDAAGTWQLQKSIDDGANWVNVGSVNSPATTTLTAVNFVVDVNAPIRFRIIGADATGTLRVNLDDISVTSFGADNPPSITNIARSSVIPNAGANLTITATISDDNDTPSAKVYYRINSGSYTSVSMTNPSGFNFTGTIPGTSLANGDFLEYYLDATDMLPQTTTSSVSKVFVGTTPISTIRVNDGNGVNIYNNVQARVSGIASYPNNILGGANMDWFVEDATGGLNVFKFGDNTYSVTVGNSYTISGTITAFNGRVEIVPATTADITDNGASVLSYQLITMADFALNPEQFEGELIGVKNLVLKSGTWPTSATFSTITLKDDLSADTIQISINNVNSGTQPAGVFDLIGVIRQNDASSPYTSGYLLVPRSSDDFAPANSLPVELSSFTVSASGKNALLKWETSTETNNAGFEVLRNGQSVGFVSGKGTTTEKQTYTFTDKNVSGTVTYQLKQVDTDGKVTLSKLLSYTGTPSVFEVADNYPNPFNPSTTIKFTLPEVSNVVVKVHNIIGQEIATLVNCKMEAGVKEVRFDASNLSSGVYFYSVSANGKTFTKSMTLMK